MAQVSCKRSRTYAYGAGSLISFDLSFLDEFMSKYRAPVVTKLIVANRMNVDTGASGGPGWLATHLIDKLVVADGGAERINLSGPSLRVVNALEYGMRYAAPPFVAINSNDVSADFDTFVPIAPIKARRRADYGIPVADLLVGGRIDLYFNAATTLGTNQFSALNSGVVELLVEVEEGRNPELKSRLVYRDYSWLLADDTYPVAGRLRSLIPYAGKVDELAGTLLTDQNWTSQDLQITNMPSKYFCQAYRNESNPTVNLDSAAAAIGDDPFLQDHTTQNFVRAAKYALPLWFPRSDQKIPYMPALNRVQVKAEAGTIPASGGKIIVGSIIGRDANLSARVLRMGSVDAMAEALHSRGVVKTAEESKDAKSFADNLRAVLPVKIK